MASQLKNQLHTYPPGASETGCAYPYCPDPIANNIALDDLNAVIDQTNLSNEIQQLLAVGLPAQSALAPEYYHMVCDQEYVDPTQLSGIVADFCLCYEDPELAASQHIDCELLSDVYWYHPDYVGSNELITDITGEPYQYFFYTPFGETILQEDAFNASYDNPFRFNGKEIDPETGNYYYGARYYNPKWSIWLSVDPLAHKYPSMSPFVFTGNNPIMLVDPDGREIDISGLLGSTDHIQAFVLFAKSKEGKEFLDKYASEGQELSYMGEVFYKANEAGFYHKEGVDISYSIKDNNSSGNGTALKYLNNRLRVSIKISQAPFGTDGRIFNIVSHLGHESFMHGNLTAEDGLDDGKKNSSNIPRDYKNVSYFQHQHNYQTFNYPANPRARDFENKMINLLDFANNELNCGFTKRHIKRNIWNFWGSYPLEKGLID